jgi:serine/threonine protein kinase
MKYFTSPTAADAEAEILRCLKHADSAGSFRFTRLIGRMGSNSLLLEPVGVQFATSWTALTSCLVNSRFQNKCIHPTKEVLCAVVDALQNLHEQSIIHRDVKMENIMLLVHPHSNSTQVCCFGFFLLLLIVIFRFFLLHQARFQVLLNDLSSSLKLSVEENPSAVASTFFAGCMQHAPDRILEALSKKQAYNPEFLDDLHMFVRMGFRCFWPVHLQADPVMLSEFWQDAQISHSFLRSGLACIKTSDPYSSLKAWVSSLSLPEANNFLEDEVLSVVVEPDIVIQPLSQEDTEILSAASASSSQPLPVIL